MVSLGNDILTSFLTKTQEVDEDVDEHLDLVVEALSANIVSIYATLLDQKPLSSKATSSEHLNPLTELCDSFFCTVLACEEEVAEYLR